MPDDNQNVLSMENFDGMLTSVDCGAQGLTLGFEDDTSFAYAQRVWDWVNGAENHTFLMVVGKGDCGSNKNRLPYLVSSIAYDEERNIASLTATEGSWKDLAHSYELRVGRVPMSTDLGLQRRDWTKDASMGLSADLGFKTKVQTGPVSGELQCNPCYTTGNINFEFVIKTSYQIPVGLRIRMAPQGVKLGATLRLNVASHFNTKQGLPERSLLKIPLSGISIPGGILTIGPVLDLQLGGEVKFEGVISITSGATATIPDTAVLQADLLDPSNNEFSSWVPSIVKEDTKVQGKVAAVLKLWLEPALKLQAEALGQGLEAGLEFRMPYIESKLEAIAAADGGACKPNDPYELGVKVSTTYGVEVKFKAGSIKGKQAVDVTIGSASLPFGPPACWGWEEPTLGSPSSLPSNPTSNTPRPTSPGSSGGGNSCTVTPTGRSGTCLATGACADSGRESTPGYCPNDPPGIQVSSSFTSEYNLQLLTGTKCCTSAQPESSSSSDLMLESRGEFNTGILSRVYEHTGMVLAVFVQVVSRRSPTVL
ncbi:MAG: hypothetical protein M1817_004213 [Caeruleum heppii]|nr:MAG: hypothetical protein M1817_004213 [Caeruleum heppii]